MLADSERRVLDGAAVFGGAMKCGGVKRLRLDSIARFDRRAESDAIAV